MEGVGGRDDDGAFGLAGEGVDVGQAFGVAAREIGVAFDDARAGDAAPLGFGPPEVTKTDEGMVAQPLAAVAQAGALDAPERPLGRVLSLRHAHAGVLHLVGEGVQDADDSDGVRAGIQAGIDHGRDLVTAIEHARMGEDEDAAGAQGGREVPLAGAVEALEGAALAEGGVLVAVEFVDDLLEGGAVEVHRRCSWDEFFLRMGGAGMMFIIPAPPIPNLRQA